mmetsp:Transcript_8329/g.22214  ORF Transcript_8329/g.22214 Transcript_8329/m.22214 type:complete len:222 (-) Transcript_8329:889-1554(-)
MYLEGSFVLGPSLPSTCRICADRYVNSQSSMNSHKCDSPLSLASGMSWMSCRMVCTMAFLYSKPPSSRSTLDKKFMRARYFWGNLRHSARMASTTTILKSSAMSDMKVPICLSSFSTLPSLPVLRRVVMASVAMERFWSAMSVSMSMLQVDAMTGWLMATLLSVRTAAKRSTGLEEDKKSCSTATAGASSRAVTSFKLQMARAASKMTISVLWRRQLSRKS